MNLLNLSPNLKTLLQHRIRNEGHAIKIEGIVNVKNGYVDVTFKNKFVNQWLVTFMSMLSANSNSNVTTIMPFNAWTSGSTYMVIGTDTATPTTASLTGLISPIGTAPGTKPNTQSVNNGVTGGTYKVTHTGLWNSGTVSGTIGEMALYGVGYNSLLGAGGTYYPQNVYMFNRACVADGDFSPITINVASPLTIAWSDSITFS